MHENNKKVRYWGCMQQAGGVVIKMEKKTGPSVKGTGPGRFMGAWVDPV